MTREQTNETIWVPAIYAGSGLVITCAVCGEQLGVESAAALSHQDDGSHVVRYTRHLEEIGR